ncbi:DUF4194 domain-containing protein [Herbaspirillum huttiense]|uniref:DUF4194 domain-containing protein n=1 Tax=Herbaspirillum huttiense TaxID=863372 RepID=UPI002176B7C2|nr:DUF4194 domain-containing protein [Herbaspirillum huttiense]UWE15648.1 DUF4194 domain-containing protein [Herbaspirillum huttiense]
MNTSTDAQPSVSTEDMTLLSTVMPSQDVMFSGDTGELRPETRRCLVALLSGPSIDGQRQPSLWAIVVRDRKILQSRLHEIFLDLVVDLEQQVAFIRQISSEDGESFPILLRRQQLTFIDSALVLCLRQRLTEADSANERAVISLQEMTDHLSVFEKAENNDGVRFDKQCLAAIEKVKALNLIRPIRASDGRFEVSPTLKLLFSAEDIQMLANAYDSLKSPSPFSEISTAQSFEDIVEGQAAETEHFDAEK